MIFWWAMILQIPIYMNIGCIINLIRIITENEYVEEKVTQESE